MSLREEAANIIDGHWCHSMYWDRGHYDGRWIGQALEDAQRNLLFYKHKIRDLESIIGKLEQEQAKWMLGMLKNGGHFDFDPENGIEKKLEAVDTDCVVRMTPHKFTVSLRISDIRKGEPRPIESDTLKGDSNG